MITVDYKNGRFVTTLSSGKSIEEASTTFISSSYKYMGEFLHHFSNISKSNDDGEVSYTEAATEKILNLLEFNQVDS